MTKLATRINEIEETECFRIVLKNPDGSSVSNDAPGFPSYEKFKNKLKDSATVQEWKDKRFAQVFAGHGVTCDVLYQDGTEAVGQTKLSTVRNTYKKPKQELSDLAPEQEPSP